MLHVHVHVDHMVSDMVIVILSFQLQSHSTSDDSEFEYVDSESESTSTSDVSEFECDDSESETTSTSGEGHLSSAASQSQSSLKSSSDGHLKGPEELLSKSHSPPRPYPLTTSQSTVESIVDQEGK